MTTYEKIAEAIDYLVLHQGEAPNLDVLACKAGMEPTNFQKKFQTYVGVSPKQLQRFMSMKRAKELLLAGYSTLDVAYEAGLSGNGRLHDLCVTVEAATPGEIKAKGKGVQIIYGWHETPFGKVLIGQTEKGICWLSFELEGSCEDSLTIFQNRLPFASYEENHQVTQDSADKIISLWGGKVEQKIRLNLFGTNFQLQVWQALLKIPRGGTVSYHTIAQALNKPNANRAVGSAVGANPVSFIIPCHRVIQQSGIIENYAWGSARKKVLLGLEASS